MDGDRQRCAEREPQITDLPAALAGPTRAEAGAGVGGRVAVCPRARAPAPGHVAGACTVFFFPNFCGAYSYFEHRHLQAEIRWRLRTVYDRQEVCELLQTLHEEGCITPRIDAVHRTFDGGPADESEEKYTYWFLAGNGRRWYQV